MSIEHDPHRATGRTGRMLDEAASLIWSGVPNLLIVAHNEDYARDLHRRLIGRLLAQGVACKRINRFSSACFNTIVGFTSFRFERTISQHRGPVLCDHYVREYQRSHS